MAEFDVLPLEEQVDRMFAVASAALPRWNLEGASLELLKHRENTVFKVTDTDGERFVMRVHRQDYHSDAALQSELVWLESLRSVGVATTEGIHCADGALFARVATEDVPAGRQCDLLAWVPGEPIGSIEEGVSIDDDTLRLVYRQVGEQAARIHNHGEHWSRPPGFERLVWDENGFFGEKGSISGRYWDLETLTEDQLALLHRARDKTASALAEFGKSPDRYGLVHGDFLPENLFFDGQTVRLIDWDDTGFGWHMYDFATGMFPHLGQPSFDVALPAMLEGYRSLRPLPDAHLAVLPYLVMARTLAYVGWVHSRRTAGRELEPMVVELACGLASELVG